MQRALPMASWPLADIALFDALYRVGSLLDGRGPCSAQRPASRRTTAFAYGSWLGWLDRHEPEALAEPPVLRATPARLLAFAKGRDDISPISLESLMRGAIQPLMAEAADRDWSGQRRILDRLRRRAQMHQSGRKTGRIRSSAELLQTGRTLAAEGTGHAPNALTAARRRRNGVMIAVLSLLPIRRNAFCNIELDRHVDPGPPFRITVDADLSKTGVPWSAECPDVLHPLLIDYLQNVRPYLARRSAGDDRALWLNDQGKRFAPNTMTACISDATRRQLGVAISPHLFRDAAATTMASKSPGDARAVRDLLGHKGFDVVDKHYNHAKMIDASRLYARLVTGQRKGRPA